MKAMTENFTTECARSIMLPRVVLEIMCWSDVTWIPHLTFDVSQGERERDNSSNAELLFNLLHHTLKFSNYIVP